MSELTLTLCNGQPRAVPDAGQQEGLLPAQLTLFDAERELSTAQRLRDSCRGHTQPPEEDARCNAAAQRINSKQGQKCSISQSTCQCVCVITCFKITHTINFYLSNLKEMWRSKLILHDFHFGIKIKMVCFFSHQIKFNEATLKDFQLIKSFYLH